MKLYVHKHGDLNIAGISYRGTFYPDRGIYTIAGDIPLLLTEAFIEDSRYAPEAYREATAEERRLGIRSTLVETARGRVWDFPEMPASYDHSEVVIHYRDGSDSRSPSKYEPPTPFEEDWDRVLRDYLGGRALR